MFCHERTRHIESGHARCRSRSHAIKRSLSSSNLTFEASKTQDGKERQLCQIIFVDLFGMPMPIFPPNFKTPSYVVTQIYFNREKIKFP